MGVEHIEHRSTITDEWFAGFVDGEGHLGNICLQPRFRLNQRDDDGDLVRCIKDWLGVGALCSKVFKTTHKHWSPNARPQLIVAVTGRDCQRVVEILDRAPLRSKKRHEYPIWRAAVLDYCAHQCTRWSDPAIKPARDARMRNYKSALEELRVYRGPT